MPARSHGTVERGSARGKVGRQSLLPRPVDRDDINLVVAGWADAYSESRMNLSGLVAALRDLESQLPTSAADSRQQVEDLIADVARAGDGAEESDVAPFMTRFLGRHPDDVLHEGRPPS